MYHVDLSPSELEAFHQGLRVSHSRTIQIDLLDLDGKEIASLDDRVLDGQVSVDMDADVTRSLSMSVLDPKYDLEVDSASPDAGAMYADRMLRVTMSYRVSTLPGKRVSVPVFTGPITKLSRTGPTVEIEAQGKEILAMGAVWAHPTVQQGSLRVDNIVMLLRDYAGERWFNISPTRTARQPETVTLGKYASVWDDVQIWARAANAQLFYDGGGVAKLRGWPGQSVWTFRVGPGGDILTNPEVSYSTDDLRNVVEVTGGIPKGGKNKIVATAVAPSTHPLSPQSIGRHTSSGRLVPRYLVERIEDDSIRTVEEARDIAKQKLDDFLLAAVEVTFDAIPIPFLEPGDLVSADLGATSVTFRLKQFTIPLGVGDNAVMSVGYLKNVQPNKKVIRK